jgi:two-component system CheB/CheR fusion protein
MENIEAMSVKEISQFLNELRVYQIEFEMQNEELRTVHVELDSARERYFDLYDMAPVGYCTISEDGLILETNLSTATLLGLTRSALIKQPLTRYILPEDQNIYSLLRKQLFDTGAPKKCELRMLKIDGSAFWMHLAAIAAPCADGTLVCRIVMSDITERRQSDEKLRESEQNFRALADSGQAMIWTSGTDKLCNYFNRVWLEFTGRTHEEEMGNGWAEGVHPDDLQRCLNTYVEAFDRREKFSMEYRLRRYDGEYRMILDEGCPRYDSHNEFTGYIGHCFDITSHKQVEDIMIQQEKLSSLGLLAAGLAHELRNPLAVISSCAQFCIENLSLDRLVTENFQMIYRNSQKASHLIRDLLAFSRPSDMQQRLLNINDILLKMLEMAKLETPPFRIVFENQLAPDLPRVSGDEEKLQQVFLNIMINAIQSVSGKGKIILKTAFHPNDGKVEASVIDNGQGIPEEYRKRIFDPFFTTKDGGTGLGLSISFSIIQLHNGTIVAEPNTSGGTRISVMLPAVFDKANNMHGAGTTKDKIDHFHVKEREIKHAD